MKKFFLANVALLASLLVSKVYAAEQVAKKTIITGKGRNDSLVVDYLKLPQLPKNPGKLIHLKKMTISPACETNDGKKRELPKWIEKLSELEELNIGTELEVADRQDCDLRIVLPSDLSKLVKLRKFIIDDAFGERSSGGISKVPMPTGLQILSLNRLSLSEIPDWVFKQSHLKRLTLQFGNIKKISEKIEDLTELESLDLSFNEVLSLPESIRGLKHLKHLNLANNHLSKAQQLAMTKLLPTVEINFGNEFDGASANAE